ncbi:MAG: type II secretion system protein [Rhodocyclaceae bacterium]|nr:type II secretion system protein [Rhodocyclaceae bacterium]
MDSLIHAVPPAPTFAQHGFTLTEMAVVLVIVALLIGGMILPLTAQQDLRARQETERSLAEIREALIGFAVVNSRLPRPATSATNGAEKASCTSDADCSGFIPWATLGAQRSDNWGKLIRYSVTPAYANNTITVTAIANRTVQTRDTAGNLIYLAGQASCSAANLCPPAIIFSHGKDRWGTTDAGMALPDGSATNADEDSNHTGPLNYFSRLPTSNTATSGGEFDDIVVWLPQSILMHRLIAAGRLP